MMTKLYSKFDCTNNSASFYFFHIPKTAGTSLNAILEGVFPQEEIFPPHLWHELLAYDKDKLSGFRLFRGHFYASLNHLVDRPLKGFVFLRDPLERALSHYGHVVRYSEHYLHKRAIELSTLKDYLQDPVTRETVRNFQAKCLVSHFDPFEIAAKLSNEELAEFGLEKVIETTPVDITDSELLARAKDALDKFCFVGITERFEDSLKQLSIVFGWDFQQSLVTLNTNSARLKASQVTIEERALLEELNSVDIELYQYALSLFDTRLKKKLISTGNTAKPFVTYAQNFEDVMLWRALKHIEKGFYIDIGAQEPIVDSVSMAFYEHGWRGVHVEPTQQYSDKLRNARPDEIVLQVAIANGVESLAFYEFENTGLSTADPQIAQIHIDSGFPYVKTVVKVISLDNLLEQFADREIHWLKLDVEGLEKSVLESWESSKIRPWILVIESTKPLTQEQTYLEWEELLFKKQYQFVYFDGLNRFYLSIEHAEMASAFLTPPNLFDGFLLSGKASHPFYQLVENRALEAEAKSHLAEAKSQLAEAKANSVESKAQHTKAELQAVHTSTPWRITAALRVLGNMKKRLSGLPETEEFKFKEKVKVLLAHSKLYIIRRPKISYIAYAVLKLFPAFKRRFKLVSLSESFPQTAYPHVPIELEVLSPKARKIYAHLTATMARRQKENG